MRRLLPLLALFWLVLPAFVMAQTEPKETLAPLLTAKDSLFLTISNGKKIVSHPVKAKQTMYALGRYYSLTLEELYEHNPQFRTDPTLRTGMRIKIPIPNMAIKRFKTKKLAFRAGKCSSSKRNVFAANSSLVLLFLQRWTTPLVPSPSFSKSSYFYSNNSALKTSLLTSVLSPFELSVSISSEKAELFEFILDLTIV